MSIDVKHLAKLARLRIEDDKLAKFEKDMESIIAMVEQLPEVSGDASGLDPEHPMKLREDVEGTTEALGTDKLTRSELLANAPKMQAGCVVVPKTVE